MSKNTYTSMKLYRVVSNDLSINNATPKELFVSANSLSNLNFLIESQIDEEIEEVILIELMANDSIILPNGETAWLS